MTEIREVNIKLDDTFTGPVCDLGVGFLKVSEDNKDASPIGTGTFARLGKTTGIIPAGHVLEALELHVELDEQNKVVKVNKKLHGIAFRRSPDHRVIFFNAAPSIDSITTKIAAKWPD